MKNNEIKKFKETLTQLNIPFKVYTIKEEPDFFRDEAVKEKAKIMVSVLTHKKQTLGDYYFNSDNKLISFSNDSIDGYSKRKE